MSSAATNAANARDHPPGKDSYTPDKTQQGHQNAFPCPFCSSHFSKQALRATHLKRSHGQARTWLCRECPTASEDQQKCREHALMHEKPKDKKAECELCDFTHKSATVVRHHQIFDHAKDGAHQPQCPDCEYKNDSFCGVSVHMRFKHPNRHVQHAAPLPTPPTTPPKPQIRPLDSIRRPGESDADAFLRSQTAMYNVLSVDEKLVNDMKSRDRTRKKKAMAKTEGRPAPDNSS